jgi:adenylylsulfate kinase-like enzyme
VIAIPPTPPLDADEVLAALAAGTPARPAGRSQAQAGPRGTPVLAATRGLPGAGKTWWAQTWQARLTSRGLAVTRVSRDDVRAAFGRNPATTTSDQEAQVTAEHHARIRTALTDGWTSSWSTTPT